MTEITSAAEERSDYGYRVSPDKPRVQHPRNGHLALASHHEALRRATLLKHRKVSTQLKLDMVQRQLAELRNSNSSSDRQFYRSQLSELSSELQDLGSTLEKVERNAFYARRRLLKSHGSLQLSASHPAIYSSTETLDQSSRSSSLKNKVQHLMSSPALKKKKHLMGELRAVASMSSLNTKPSSHVSCDDIPSKETRSWKSPLRFLGSIMDNRICRRLLGSSKRINKSLEHLESGRPSDFRLRKDDDSLPTTSSESSDDSGDDERQEFDACKTRSCVWKGPVERRVSKSQQGVDPALMAEIEDFEKMAAQYIKLHS